MTKPTQSVRASSCVFLVNHHLHPQTRQGEPQFWAGKWGLFEGCFWLYDINCKFIVFVKRRAKTTHLFTNNVKASERWISESIREIRLQTSSFAYPMRGSLSLRKNTCRVLCCNWNVWRRLGWFSNAKLPKMVGYPQLAISSKSIKSYFVLKLELSWTNLSTFSHKRAYLEDYPSYELWSI